MSSFLDWLLEPSPSSPFNPHSGRDNRTVSEKVVSGLRLGGGLVTGFLVLLVAFAGLSSLPEGALGCGPYSFLLSWSMFSLATIVMLWTANRWAPYVPGFFVFPALFKSLALILIGPNPHSPIPSNGLTRAEAAELVVYCVVVIALTWRFVGNRPAPTRLVDRLALTFFVLATLKQAVIPFRWPPLPLISGFAALLIAWWINRKVSAHMLLVPPNPVVKRKLLAVSILIFLAVPGWSMLRPGRHFDATLWRNSATPASVRVRMADDLVNSQMMVGLARQEVVALLGEPPRTEYFKEFDLVYYLGPERGFISIDLEWLVLKLDPEGRVKRASIARD